MKLQLGKFWDNRVRENFRYMMVFDQNPIEDADKLADALRIEKL